MPSYSRNVRVPGKSAQELYDRVSQDIDRFAEKANVGKFHITRDPASRVVELKSSMADAKLTCHDGELRLDARLSLFAAPFRGKLDEGIDRWIAKTFNTTDTA